MIMHVYYVFGMKEKCKYMNCMAHGPLRPSWCCSMYNKPQRMPLPSYFHMHKIDVWMSFPCNLRQQRHCNTSRSKTKPHHLHNSSRTLLNVSTNALLSEIPEKPQLYFTKLSRDPKLSTQQRQFFKRRKMRCLLLSPRRL